METTRAYLVLDLEATCDEQHRIPREETEIIEIGAVLCDGGSLAPLAEFQTFVRPRRHPNLTAFCTKLTSITQRDVDGAPPFAEAMAMLGRWLAARAAGGQFTFCSWGDYDRAQLQREASRNGVRVPLGPRHLNLKQAFRDASGADTKLGVGGALRRIGFQFEGTAHRGIDDARNIARLLPYCLGRRPIP